jgi:hypothetical protein
MIKTAPVCVHDRRLLRHGLLTPGGGVLGEVIDEAGLYEAMRIVHEFLSRNLGRGAMRTKTKFHELPAGEAIIDVFHDELVSYAQNGWRDASNILCDFAEGLKSKSKPWPTWLMEHFIWAERNRGKGDKMKRGKRGRHAFDLLYRAEIIAAAVNFLVIEAGLRPYRTKRLTSPISERRNRARTTKKNTKRSECACSIVEKTLKEVGINMGYSNVAAIWYQSCKRTASIFLFARTYTNDSWSSEDEIVCGLYCQAKEKFGFFPLEELDL